MTMDRTLREVLEERGRLLARPAVMPSEDVLELVTFALARETYAIESRYVFAVFRLGEMSPLPGARAPVLGLTSWRGGTLTIVDLRRALGVSATGLDDLSRVVVVGSERPAFGMLADSVGELLRTPASAVREPSEGVAAGSQYLRGITADATLVLDGRQLVSLHL